MVSGALRAGGPGADLPGHTAGMFYGPGGISSTRTVAQGNLFLVPFVVRSACSFDRIVGEVTTAGTGSTVVRMGLWQNNPATGLPGELIVDGGTIDGTSQTLQTVTVSVNLPRGAVWLGCAGQTVGGSPVVRGFTGFDSRVPQTGTGSITAANTSVLVTGVTGAFASLVGASFVVNGTAPNLLLRAA